jgi:parallel beta-helix repeat protein
MVKDTVLLTFIFILSAFLLSVQGTVYYIDRNDPQANDANPGTAVQPWLTIQHAADTVHAGDTIIVKEGIYKERIRFASGHSGSENNPVVFKAEPRRSVTMWGFYTRNCDYLRIEGFSIIGDTSLTDWTDVGGVFIYSDFVDVVDNYFFEITIGIRSYWHEPYPEGGYVANNRIYRCQSGICINGIDWIIENNEVERLIWGGSGDADYSRLFGENIVFRGNHFHGSREDEIGDAHVDCWQTFTNNGEYLRNALLEANICEQCHQGLMASNVDTTDCHDIIFRNNIFNDCWAWGLCVYDISNFTVENNTFVNIKYHAAGFNGNSTGNIVRNNIFYNANSGYWAQDGGEVSGDYNLLFNTDDGTPAPHNIIGLDPLFVNPDSNDFRLQEGSPAIDSGMTLTGFNTDIIGTIRPKGDGWDIGAYEYNGNIGIITQDNSNTDCSKGLQIVVKKAGVMISYPWTGTITTMNGGRIKSPVVKIYTVSGKSITQLPVRIAKGRYTALWDGYDTNGYKCPAGCYIAQLINTIQTIKKHFIIIP